MRLGLIVGMAGSLVGSATVAGASYLAWDQFRTAAVSSQLSGFEKVKEALDIDIKYEKSVGEVLSGRFALEKVTIISDDKRLDVERVEFKDFDWKNPAQPRHASLALTGMNFKVDVFSGLLGADLVKALADANITDLVVDAAIEHEAGETEGEDPKTKRKVKQNKVTIKEFKLAFRDLGTFTATIELRDFAVRPKAVARQKREEPPLVRLLGENVLLAGLRIVFEDKGLMKALMDAKAREIGKGELQARGVFVRELQKDAQATRSTVGSNRFDRDFFEPMIRYIGGGYERTSGFTLIAAPPAPFEIRRLFVMWEANRGGFFDKFNPKIEIGAARAAPRREPPPKREPPKREEPKREPQR